MIEYIRRTNMFEAIWSALDFWQRFGVVMLAVMIPVGVIAELILNRDVRRWSK